MDACYILQKMLSAVREGRRKELIKYIGPSGFAAPASRTRGWLLLREAVKFNQIKTVRFLLNNKAPVNNPVKIRATSPLHLGVEKNNMKIVNLLLAYNAKINVKNKCGMTPLNIAVNKGYYEIFCLLFLKGCKESDKGKLLLEAIRGNQYKLVHYLLKLGVPVNYSPEKSNLTPLQCALNLRSWKIIQLLLKHGADLNVADKDGRTILFYAIEYKKTKVLEEILKCGVNVNTFDNCGESPLHLAFRSGFDEYFDLLMQYGADIYAHDQDNYTLLFEAVTELQPKKVKLVLKYRTEYNEEQEKHCFFFLFEKFLRQHDFKILPNHKSKFKETLETLLDHGFSVSAFVKSADKLMCEKIKVIMNAALMIESDKLVENVLQSGRVADCIWSEQEYPLLVACKMNNVIIAEILLKAGADVNYCTSAGTSPILYAIQNMNLELTKLLLNSKSNYSIADLFYYAVTTGSKDILNFLFEYKPDFNIDCIDNEKGSLISIASWWGRESIMRILLDLDVSANTRDMFGDTALHHATVGRRKSCIELLLRYSLDINLRNNAGFTPFKYCRQNPLLRIGYDEISLIFLKHIIKLYYAGFDVNEEDSPYILEYRHDSSLYINEVKSLKTTKIGNSSISYYNILHGRSDCLAKYMQNVDVQRDYSTEQFVKLFPLYSDFLRTKYRLGQRRKILLDKGYEVFILHFSKDIMLPQEIINRILSHLSNAELRLFTGITSGDTVVCFNDIRPW